MLRSKFNGYSSDGSRLLYKGGGKGGAVGAIAGAAAAVATGGASLLAGAAVGAGLGLTYDSLRQSKAQAKAQEKAAAQSAAQAKEQYNQQQQAINRQNKKYADVAGLLSENQQAALSGLSGTSLTGSQGVDTGSLLLGRKGALGG